GKDGISHDLSSRPSRRLKVFFKGHSTRIQAHLKGRMIFEQDIKKERAQLWHMTENARPLRTLDDAREFLNSVGFCLAYPVRGIIAPTFIGAYVGSEEKLPTAKQAFADANARAATELIVRLLSEKSAFEVAFGEDS